MCVNCVATHVGTNLLFADTLNRLHITIFALTNLTT